MTKQEKITQRPVQSINEQTIHNQKEQVIILVIKDAILWRRVSDGMHAIVNAFNPDIENESFNVEDNYGGFENALRLMGIYDNYDLREELSEIFWTMQTEKIVATELAEKIYLEWLVCIRNYCVTLKTVA